MKQKFARKFSSLIEAQENTATGNKPDQKSRNPKKINAKTKNSSRKFSKTDPDYYSKIGKISAKNRLKAEGKKYFSEMAKKSHPRDTYNGGRPKKVQGENSDGLENRKAT
jgi:hypothetical protein